MKGKKKKASADLAIPGLNLSQFEGLLAFMAEHGLEEFEYSHGDLHIRLKKPPSNSNPVAARLLSPPDIVLAGPAPPAAAELPAAPRPGAAEFAAALAEDLHVAKSPIVGTFYHAPSPGAEPLVKIGDHVEVGQVLCIIEAMKLMNEIESEVAGEVMRIFVENGQAVEYGEPLFAIRPTRKK